MNTRATTGSWTRAIRLVRMGLHMAGGAARAAVLLPLLSPAGRRRQARLWCARLLGILGIRVRASASTGLADPALFLCNHVSWIDICVVNALREVRFVAKSDVADWPIMGYLAAKAGALFIRRRHLRDLRRVKEEAVTALSSGESVVVFPEGTTTDGSTLLPFHTGLVQAAVDAAVPVQPVAIRYSAAAPAFVADMTFIESLRRVLACRSIEAEVHFGRPLAARGKPRRKLSRVARESIARPLGLEPAALPQGPAAFNPQPWRPAPALA